MKNGRFGVLVRFKIALWFMASFWLMVALPIQAAIEAYEFETAEQQAQFYEVIPLLRCPKCQNQSISDSDAPIAKDIKFRVRRLIEEGATNEEIIDYMVARYGDFVSYRPPLTAGTWALWFGPPLVLVLVLLGLWWQRGSVNESDVDGSDVLHAESSESISIPEFKLTRVPAKQQWVFLLVILLGVAGVYFTGDRFKAVMAWWQAKESVSSEVEMALASPESLLTLLATKDNQGIIDLVMSYQQEVQQGKGSAATWSALAEVYSRLDRFEEAYQARRKAYLEAPDQVPYAIAVVQADMARENADLSQYSERLLDRMSGQYPEDPKVLSFIGLAYHASGQLDKARTVFEHLLQIFDEQQTAKEFPEVVRAIQNMLARMDLPVQKSQGTAQTSESEQLNITVSVSAGVADALSGNETLFVFAKAVTGPKFPLAVVKQAVTTWPVTVVLSEQNRMMAGVDWLDHLPLIISARISKTGEAIAQPGDWEALGLEVDSVSGQMLELHINL